MAISSTERKRRQDVRKRFALNDTLKPREKNGRVSRKGRTREERIPPSKELMQRREQLGLERGDCTECWIDLGKAQGLLTKRQHRAIHRYKAISNGYGIAIEAPHQAADILASFLPRSGGDPIPEDALKALEEYYHETHAALNNASRKESDELERYTARGLGGALPPNGAYQLIAAAAEWLADYFGFEQEAA